MERAHGAADTGTLVEIDKARQLLFLVVDGKTVWTFNTSTGSGIAYEAANKNDPTKIEKGDAVTPDGLFHTTTGNVPRVGGKATSARSTGRSTSSAASPSTA